MLIESANVEIVSIHIDVCN